MASEFNSAESLRLIFSNDPALKVQALKLASLDQFIRNFVPGQMVSGKVIDQLPSGKNLVELNGQRAAVEFDRAQLPGQTFQARVEQLAPTPVFKLISGDTKGQSAIPSAGKNDFSNRAGGQDQVQVSTASQRTLPSSPVYTQRQITQLGLIPGETIQGQLVSILDSSTVQVRVNGRDISVFYPNTAGLAEGDRLTLSAEAKGDGFTLAASGTEKNNPAVKLLQTLLPGRQPLSQLIKDFEGLFARLNESDPKAVPKELKTRLQDSLNVLKASQGEPVDAKLIRDSNGRTGASYEARLRQFLENPKSLVLKEAVSQDFKGQLQELSKYIEKQFGTALRSGDTMSQALVRQTRAVIQNLDIHQLTQVVARQENHPMSLMIPNMLEPQGRSIKVFYRGEEGESKSDQTGGKDKYTLVFLLELSQLGNVRLDARVRENKLGLNIAVENEQVLDFIQTGFAGFQDQLSEMGFDANLEGQVSSEKAQEAPEEFPDNMLKNLNSLVDLRT